MEKSFGLHQTLDCYGCNTEKLNDRKTISRFLNQLPEKINMHKIKSPDIFEAPPVSEKDQGGFTGGVWISESHIAIHTFPKKRFMSIDIYSCNKFPTETVKDYVKEIFGVSIFEENIIVRGKRFRELTSPQKIRV